ncbi:MAG: hypothetical protein AB1512_24635 [Thermodesulfobacteriota bacterium]
MEIADAVRTLNEQAESYELGRLQSIREQLRGRPTRTSKVFSAATVFDHYAYHDGGRHEMQFNVGLETRGEPEIEVFRYGVAFSLEPSRANPDPSELFPKIERFNYYIRTESQAFPDFRLWCWSETGRGPDCYPRPFDPEEIRIGNFLFFGKWVPSSIVDFDQVLSDLDCLLPLYVFVESGTYMTPAESGGEFHSGCTIKKTSTVVSRTSSDVDVALRHNELQLSLYELLCAEYGPENVATEHWIDSGGRVDAAVRRSGQMTFFEIKVAPSARSALREGLGQLLEYAHWPSKERADELVIVSEAPADHSTAQYLNHIRSKFNLNVFYRQLITTTGELKPGV